MVIARYITKEIFSAFFAITFVLLFIAISNRFVLFLAKAAAGKLPIGMVFQVMGLYIPEVFGMLAPIALFSAILFTHSRLHADSEVSVLFTSGFDWGKLIKFTMIAAVVISILVAVINLLLAPYITTKREKLLQDGQAIGAMYAITPGQIHVFNEYSNSVFYVEDIDEDRTLRNVFIADNANNVTITAKSAFVKRMEDSHEFYLILRDGHRYSGVPGSAEYSVTSFGEYGREVKFDEAAVPNTASYKPTNELFNAKTPAELAELQWRLSMPFVVLILALLAVPVAKVNPRQGRYAKFLPAALIYMLYYNSLTVVRRWIAAGDIPVYPGLWAVHIVFLIFAVLYIWKVSGRLNEYIRSIHR